MATQGRMLLSHNYDIFDSVIPLLSRDAFAQVFTDGLGAVALHPTYDHNNNEK